MTEAYETGKIYGWNGGECTVHPQTVVEYWLRSGVNDRSKAQELNWKTSNHPRDIIAFQVITPYVEPVPPRECWSFGSLNFFTEAEALDLRARVALDNPGQGYEDMPITKWREVKE